MSYAAVFTIALTALAAAGITLSAGPAQANPGPATTNQHLSSDELLAQYPAFASEYARYQPSADALAQMQQLQGLQLVVLYGSWCHDSEREVPRLLKLLQQSNVALSSLQLAPVNQQKQHPVQSEVYPHHYRAG